MQKLGAQTSEPEKESAATSPVQQTSVRSGPTSTEEMTPVSGSPYPPKERNDKSIDTYNLDDSMTPPVSSTRSNTRPEDPEENDGEEDEEGKEVNKVSETEEKTATNNKAQPKKSEWDMFAEQDLDSNFDVSVKIELKLCLFFTLPSSPVKSFRSWPPKPICTTLCKKKRIGLSKNLSCHS